MAVPPSVARHIQVLRLQPGQMVELFDGQGGAWHAEITRMTRTGVSVRLCEHQRQERELTRAVHIAICLPANERMDWLVEKATELGAASVQPLISARSILRLNCQDEKAQTDERSAKKVVHWQAIAQAACEQCGRNRLPLVHPVHSLAWWLQQGDRTGQGFVLTPPQEKGQHPKPQPLLQAIQAVGEAHFLIGPEGGLTQEEMHLAQQCGLHACHLGPRILRAETAPLAILAAIGLLEK